MASGTLFFYQKNKTRKLIEFDKANKAKFFQKKISRESFPFLFSKFDIIV